MAVIGNYNRQSPTLLGSEWRPSSSRNVVLSTKTKAVAQRFVPGNVTADTISLYLSAINGTPGIAAEIVSTLTPTLDTPSIRYPGTNTGATKSAWIDEAGGTSDYTDLDQQVFDGTHYLKPNTSALAQLLFRGQSSISAGKRIVDITQSIVISFPGAAAGGVKNFFYTPATGTSYASVTGVMNISGVDYNTGLTVPSPIGEFSTFSSPALATNPSTGLPWTLTEANALCSGSDEWGITKAKSIYTLEHRICGMYLTVNTCTENRVARYHSKTGQTAGWQTYTLTGPDGGAISAFSANTYYYLVIYLLNTAGGASLTLPALQDTNLILASSASASTGDFRQTYTCDLDSGIVTNATARPGEMIPAIVHVTTPAYISDSNPYVALTPLAVSTGPSQEITAASGTDYAGIRLNVGWQSTNLSDGTLPPDAPLAIEIRKGAGAATGGGTLSATATLAPDALTTGGLQDVQVAFDAAFTSTASQYYCFLRSSSTTDRGWVVGQLDTGSNKVTTISAANVQAQSIGGTTDSYVDTSGTEDDRYDIPMLLIPTVSALSGLAATVVSAA